MNSIESLMFAEGSWSDVRFGVVAVEVGAVRGGIWIGARRIWIGMGVVSKLRISILYSVHVQVHGAGCVVEVNRVCFVSCLDFLHKLGVEVEGVAGLYVCEVHGVVVSDLV